VPVKVVGVLPAAGRAERLQPLAGSKELLELGGRPVLEYAVERLRAAGADEIRIVTRPDKADLREHARVLGLEVVLAEPATVAESIRAGVDGIGPDAVVLVDLPDCVWEPVDGFARLVGELSPATDVVLGVFPSTEPERGDVVDVGADGVVRGVAVKPAEPAGNLVWGAVVARPAALAGLGRHDEPGHLFDELARRGRARAVPFPSEFIDIGTKEALARARKEIA
jgi:glucose-1-phosphate thymidylyltransferase